METSWYGLFSFSPNDTLEVRAGDLQGFMRQQMMGVPNPGLTVTTSEERNLRLALQPEQDDKDVFCTVRWTRTDILNAIESACGVRPDRDLDYPEEAEKIVNYVIDAVTKELEESCDDLGQEVFEGFISQEVSDYVVALYDKDGKHLNAEELSETTSFIESLQSPGGAIYQPDTCLLVVSYLEQNPPTIESFSINPRELMNLVRSCEKRQLSSDLTIQNISREIPPKARVGTYHSYDEFMKSDAGRTLREGEAMFNFGNQGGLSSFIYVAEMRENVEPTASTSSEPASIKGEAQTSGDAADVGSRAAASRPR